MLKNQIELEPQQICTYQPPLVTPGPIEIEIETETRETVICGSHIIPHPTAHGTIYAYLYYLL